MALEHSRAVLWPTGEEAAANARLALAGAWRRQPTSARMTTNLAAPENACTGTADRGGGMLGTAGRLAPPLLPRRDPCGESCRGR
jgi:hypothetical protein